MPYLLESTSEDRYVNPASKLIIGANVGDYLEYKGYGLAGNIGDDYRILANKSGFSNYLLVSPEGVKINIDGTNYTFSSGYVQPLFSEVFVVRIAKISLTVFEAFLNGISIGQVITPSGTKFETDQFFTVASRAVLGFRGGSYYFEVCTNGTGLATNRWENTTGTGSEWIDQIAGNNAIQMGAWPTDDSEWVYYPPGTPAGPNTPVNPSITNLLATSARLNWEQG